MIYFLYVYDQVFPPKNCFKVCDRSRWSGKTYFVTCVLRLVKSDKNVYCRALHCLVSDMLTVILAYLVPAQSSKMCVFCKFGVTLSD